MCIKVNTWNGNTTTMILSDAMCTILWCMKSRSLFFETRPVQAWPSPKPGKLWYLLKHLDWDVFCQLWNQANLMLCSIYKPGTRIYLISSESDNLDQVCLEPGQLFPSFLCVHCSQGSFPLQSIGSAVLDSFHNRQIWRGVSSLACSSSFW